MPNGIEEEIILGGDSEISNSNLFSNNSSSVFSSSGIGLTDPPHSVHMGVFSYSIPQTSHDCM